MLKARLVLFLSVTTLVFTSISSLASAAIGTSGYSVSPLKIDLDAAAGESKEVSISLANLHKDVQLNLNVNFYNFVPQQDGSPKIDQSPTLPTGISTWLKGPKTFLLNAGQNDAYIAAITVPKTTAAGAYYGVVTFNNQDNSNDSAVGVNVIVNVGTVSKSLAIESVGTAGLQITNQWRAIGQVDLLLKGTGTGYFIPEKMIIELLDANKNTIESIDANAEQGGILPGYSRKFTVPVDKLLSPNQKYYVRAKVYTAVNTAPVTAESEVTTPAITATTKTPAKPSPESKPKLNLFLLLGGTVAVLLITMLVLFLLHDRKKKRFATTPPVRTAQMPNLMPISSATPNSLVAAPPEGHYTPPTLPPSAPVV